MIESTQLEQTLKRIRLKFEEGQDKEALLALDAIVTDDPKEQRDIAFTRAWHYARTERWDVAVSLLASYYDAQEIEAGWLNASQTERGRRAHYLLWLGDAAVNFSYYEDAAFYFSQCLNILEKRRVHLPDIQIKALFGYATTCIPLGLYASAIQLYQDALKVCAKEKLTKDIAHIYYGLADANRLIGNLDQAESYGKKALELYREDVDRSHACRIYNLLGRISYQLGNYHTAADYYMESLTIATIDNLVGMKLINFVAVADLRLAEGRLDEAMGYSDHALEICGDIQNDHHTCGLMYMVRGKIAQAQAAQKQDSAILYKAALSDYEEARRQLNQTQARTHLTEVLGHIAEVYEALHRPEEALAYWKSAFADNISTRAK